MASSLLARLIRMGGGKLLDTAVERVLPARPARAIGTGLATGALARLATRSVPGAILVGGGLLAKMLYDRRHARAQVPAAPAPPPAAPSADDEPHVLG